jgi:hypothetical protein
MEPIKTLRNLIQRGQAELSITGICSDLLMLRPEICTVLYVQDETFSTVRSPSLNWEYEKLGPKGKFGLEWSRIDEVLATLVDTADIVVSGAACVELGRQWIKTRHQL